MTGFCPHDWHQTTEDDMHQMSLGEDFWLFGGEALLRGYSRPDPALVEANRLPYAIHDKAIELARSEGKTFHLLPDDQQTLFWKQAEAQIAGARGNIPCES